MKTRHQPAVWPMGWLSGAMYWAVPAAMLYLCRGLANAILLVIILPNAFGATV